MTEIKAPQLQIQIDSSVLGGTYSNNMVVTHTREEFFLDFCSMTPTGAKVVSRVIVTPGHMKRILRAMSENLAKYETSFGPVPETEIPYSTGAMVN